MATMHRLHTLAEPTPTLREPDPDELPAGKRTRARQRQPGLGKAYILSAPGRWHCSGCMQMLATTLTNSSACLLQL
jgi:hypothetical protein